MANPAWFNFSTYMTNKLTSVKAADPDGNWDAQKLSDAFSEAGFPGEEGAYAHFQQYGNTADENISPNANFVPSQYYIFKAASYYNKAVADVTDAEAASISTAIHDAGMSAWQHYINYGTAEKINPSNNFDTAKYLEAKAAALNAAAVDGKTDWDADSVAAAFKDAGMNALEHAILYSADDTPGEAAKAFNDNGSVIDAYSVTEKAAEGDDGGATFTLSARTDYADQTTAWTMDGDVQSDFHFTGGNETVNAVAGTLQANDILIDGSSDDADVLNATVIDSVASAGALVAPKLTNIETINLTVQGADAGLDMANVIGTKTVSVTGSQNGVLDNIAKASIPDVTVENYAKTLTLNFADLSGTTKNGTAETLNLTVKGGTAKTVVNLTDSDTGGTLENLNITSSGDSANVLKITSSQPNAVSLETTKVSGTQDLNLSLKHGVVSGSALSTSDFSGKLGLTVDRDGALAATTNLTEVTGVTTYTFTDSTAGGDTLKASGIADGSTVVVAADFDGANTLAVSGAASSTANTLTLTLDADGDKAADVAIGTGLTIADVETITINSDNGKTAHTIDALTADAAKTINIVGDTALHLNMADTTSTLNTVTFGGAGKHEFTFDGETYADKVNLTLDGGSATGNLTLDASKFTGSGNNTLTINGGEGDDTITSALVGANVSAVINAGLGKDVITLSGTEEKYTIDLGKDDDTDTINLTTSGADQNMSITNFTLGSGGDKLVMDGLTTAVGTNVAKHDTAEAATAGQLNVYTAKVDSTTTLAGYVDTGMGGTAAIAVCDDTGLAELYVYDATAAATVHVATFTDIKAAGLDDLVAENLTFGS